MTVGVAVTSVFFESYECVPSRSTNAARRPPQDCSSGGRNRGCPWQPSGIPEFLQIS